MSAVRYVWLSHDVCLVLQTESELVDAMVGSLCDISQNVDTQSSICVKFDLNAILHNYTHCTMTSNGVLFLSDTRAVSAPSVSQCLHLGGARVDASFIASLRSVPWTPSFDKFVSSALDTLYQPNRISHDLVAAAGAAARAAAAPATLRIHLFHNDMPIDHVVYPWEQTLYDVLHGSLSFVMEVADMFVLRNMDSMSYYEKSWFYSIDGRLILIPDGTLINDVKGFPLHIMYVNRDVDAGAIVRQIRPIANVRTRSISGFECVSTVRTARPFMFYESHAPAVQHTLHVIHTGEHRIVTCTFQNMSNVESDDDLPHDVKRIKTRNHIMLSGHRLDDFIEHAKLFLVHRAVLRLKDEREYKLRIPTSISEFRIADRQLRICARTMRSDYAFFMDVSGDGDCFYRAFFIGVFVTSLRVRTRAPFKRVIRICRWYLQNKQLQIARHSAGSLLRRLEQLELNLDRIYDEFNYVYLSIEFMHLLYHLHAHVWNEYDADVIACLRHAIGSSLWDNQRNNFNDTPVPTFFVRTDYESRLERKAGTSDTYYEIKTPRAISFQEAIREIFTFGKFADAIFQFVSYLFECPFRVRVCNQSNGQISDYPFSGSRLNACHVELANEGSHYYILIPKVITEIPARRLTGANPYQGYDSHR